MVVPKQMVNWPTGRRRGFSSSKELQRYSQQLQTLSHSIQKDGHMRRHHMFWQLKVVFLQLAGRGVNLQGSASLVHAGVQLFRMSPQPHGAEKYHHPRLAAWRCVIKDPMLYITSSVCLELVLLQIIDHNVCPALWCWWVGQLNQWMAPGGAFLQVTSVVLMFHALDDKQPGVAWLRTGRLEEEVTWLRLHQWHGSEIDRSHAMTQLQLP